MMTETMPIHTGAGASPVRRLVMFWTTAGALAAIAVLPYAIALNPALLERVGMPIPLLVFAQFAKAFVQLALLSWAGLRLGQAIGLGSPLAQALAYRKPAFSLPGTTLALAAVAGAVMGALLPMLDRLFLPFMPGAAPSAPTAIDLWKRVLASFYGGITEELICRLFLMTLIVWICWKFASHKGAPPRAWMIWSGIVGASLVFGIGHLPAASGVWPLTAAVIARTLVLNGLGGIAFGWLYWRRGLEHAVLAHFAADIVVHVIGGS